MKKQIFLCALLCITLCSCSSKTTEPAATTNETTASVTAESSAQETVSDEAVSGESNTDTENKQGSGAWSVSYWTGTDVPYISTSSDFANTSLWSEKGVETIINAFDTDDYTSVAPLSYKLVYLDASPDCQFVLYLWQNQTDSIKNNSSDVKYYDVSILRDNEKEPTVIPVGLLPPAAEEGNPGDQCLRLMEDPEAGKGKKLFDVLSANESFTVLVTEKGGTATYFFEVNGNGFSEAYNMADWSKKMQ